MPRRNSVHFLQAKTVLIASKNSVAKIGYERRPNFHDSSPANGMSSASMWVSRENELTSAWR
jgi:hypothetical protein